MESFQPADGFIRYLKLHFWFYLLLIDVAIVAVWLVVTIKWPTVGAILAVPALLIAVVPDVIAFSAIHLRYDTTWYVMTDRSLRIRRGIWIIHETTITFENVQNVSINQGPIQRWFGIADVLIETAGGGGQRHETSGAMLSHKGLIEGVADAHLRDKLLVRLKQSRTTGLGEDDIGGEAPMWTAEHIAVLREIRDAIRSRTRTSGGAST
ncbi:MAG: hypothetical protein CMJ64_30280 [Planctomycetaceae bacterium]|nr:hypothetical protein [Planctomycetaceae bacterium]